MVQAVATCWLRSMARFSNQWLPGPWTASASAKRDLRNHWFIEHPSIHSQTKRRPSPCDKPSTPAILICCILCLA